MKTRIATTITDIHSLREGFAHPGHLEIYCRVSRCTNRYSFCGNNIDELLKQSGGWTRSPDNVGFICNTHNNNQERRM